MEDCKYTSIYFLWQQNIVVYRTVYTIKHVFLYLSVRQIRLNVRMSRLVILMQKGLFWEEAQFRRNVLLRIFGSDRSF
jgi:hypothetical protein